MAVARVGDHSDDDYSGHIGGAGVDIERDLRHMQHLMHGVMKNMPQKRNLHSMHDREAVEPQIVDESDGKKSMKWHFDLTGFRPEDVHLRTMGDKMEIKARSEEKSEHHANTRELTRTIALPANVDLEKMKSRLSHKGVLTIEVPYTPAVGEKEGSSHHEIAIKHEKHHSHGHNNKDSAHNKDSSNSSDSGKGSNIQIHRDLKPTQAAAENSRKSTSSHIGF